MGCSGRAGVQRQPGLVVPAVAGCAFRQRTQRVLPKGVVTDLRALLCVWPYICILISTQPGRQFASLIEQNIQLPC